MQSDLTPFQIKVLDVLKAFDEFCKQNSITYYASCGTLLGVIRHKGFIPWDDDVDVWMTREEYNKFLKLKDKLQGTEFRIGSIEDDNYPYEFAKFFSTNGTLQEYEHFRFLTGPWVDIFPLNECEVEDPVYDRALENLNYAHWRYRKSIAYYPLKGIVNEFLKGNIVEGAIRLFKKIVYSPWKDKYKKEFLAAEDVITKHEGCLYNSIADLRKSLFRKEWFGEPLYLPFEDMMLPVPSNYDEVLKVKYKDYMKLPPVEQRISRHDCYFMDMDRKMTFEEIEKDPRKSKSPVMSLCVIWDEIKHRKGF